MNLWQHHPWNGLLRSAVAIMVCIIVLSAITVTLAAGFLDPSFGANGVTITSLDGNSSGASVAIQADGKVVVAGSAQGHFALVRYTVTGTLDAAFGAQGIVTTAVSATGQDFAGAVVIQPDGQLVVAGGSSEGLMNSFLALARYTTTGALDPEFGVGGIVTTPIGTSFVTGGGASAVALQPDGKIVVAGNGPMAAYSFVARYTITGSLDTGFGNNGMVALGSGGTNFAGSLVTQPDHKIVVAGTSSGHVTVVRLNPNGLFDTSFGINGIVQTSVPNSVYAGASAASLQTDGKIVVTGATLNNSSSKNDILVARYSVTGTLDASFGSGGIVTTTLGPRGDGGSSIIVQPDGRIVVGGSSDDGVRNNFALVRYSGSGAPDAGWGTGGVVTSSVGASFSVGLSAARQPDGKIVLAGYSSDDGVKTDFSVARYLGDVYTNFIYLPVIRRE